MKADALRRMVVDASVAVAWCFEDESSGVADKVLDRLAAGAEAFAPAIWPFEVANALLTAERRKRIKVAQTAALLQRVARLPVSIEPLDAGSVLNQMFSLAREHALTVYDAAYLELALRKGLPLATLDNQLHRSAVGLGLALVGA
jgi:predicted nucleic acid-binding protein